MTGAAGARPFTPFTPGTSIENFAARLLRRKGRCMFSVRRQRSRLVRLGEGQQLIRLHVADFLDAAANPADFDTIDAVTVSQPEVKLRSVVALVAAPAVDFVELNHIAGRDLDVRSNAVPIRHGPHESDLNPMLGIPGVIAQDRRPVARIEHHDIHVTVVIEVVDS